MSRHRRLKRLVTVASLGLALAHFVEALVLRRRWQQMKVLPTLHDERATATPGEVATISMPGATLGGDTLAAVAAEMEVTGAGAVDLLPGDLPVERTLGVLRRVDGERLGRDPVYTPGGAHEVVALHPSVASRLGIDDPPVEVADRGELVRWTVNAQRYAPASTALRLAPDLRAGPDLPEDRWRELEERAAGVKPYVSLHPVLVAAETAHLLALSGAVMVTPAVGAVALASWCAKPALVLGGSAKVSQSLLRLPQRWADNLRTILAGYQRTRVTTARRASAPVPAAPRSEDLFEPQRRSCPWCGTLSLVGRLETTDLMQHKPGRFHLDECTECGHIFQNPALSTAGLDYYYDNFYDGVGREQWQTIFSSRNSIERDRSRVRAVTRFTEPRAWLDVGTGYGYLCLVARQQLPETTFDGLDMGESIEEAQRRGWVDTGHRGLFLDLAGRLPQSYDVVSMHHYLEHTREPLQELAAATKILNPGGCLMIEVPDPATPWARHLGPLWFPWAQPQHLHLASCENLIEVLEGSGLEVVSVERGAATLGAELTLALLLAIENLAPSPHLPWLPAPSLADRVKRNALCSVAVPAFVATVVVDQIIEARLRRPGTTRPGSAYRLVARKNGDG